MRGEIKGLLDQAEQADTDDAPDPQGLPEELSRRDRLRAKLDRACAELVATGAEGHRRQHDFSAEPPPKPAKELRADWIKAMREKMELPEKLAYYRLRKQTVEPVFGIVKQAMGFRQFLLRGVEKVEGEWALVTLAYNCRRLHNLMLA